MSVTALCASSRSLLVALSAFLVSVSAGFAASEETPSPPRQAVADVMRAHVTATGREPGERKRLKQEISETHQLLEMALRHAAGDSENVNLALLRAQLIRLRPLVDAEVRAAGGASEFSAIAAALSALEAELAATESGDGVRRLLERIGARPRPGAGDPLPTFRQSSRPPVLLGE